MIKLERFQGYILSLLVLLLPVFWLPVFFEAWEFPKIGLLFFLSLIAFGFTLAIEISKKKFKILWPFDALVIGFALIFCVSALFSIDRVVSLFGFYARFSDGLLALISLVFAYFSISRYSQNQKLLKLLLVSAALACLPIFKFFNLVAPSFEGLSMFLAALVFVSLNQEKKIFRFFSLAFLSIIVLIDYYSSWLVLVFVSAAYLIYLLIKGLQKQDKLLVLSLAVLLTISLAGLIWPVPNFFNLPREVTLNRQLSFEMAKQALILKPILGSGPGTFAYTFSKFRPAVFNQSSFWQIRFDRPLSHLNELSVNCGLLGLMGFLAIAIFGLKTVFGKPLFFPFLASFLSLAVYYQNITLGFVFWLILALMATENSVSKEVSLEKIFKSRTVSIVSLGFVSLLAVLIVLITFRLYSGDYFYNQSFKSPTEEIKVAWLQKAVSANPLFAQYQVMLSQAFLNQTVEESGTLDSDSIFQLVAKSVQAAKASTEIAPFWVVSWESLGSVHQKVLGLAAGAEDWSLNSFTKALELEPSNPLLYFKLGKIYFFQNNYDKARESFILAQTLKPDLIDPRIYLALITENQVGVKAAINSLSHLQNLYPLNPDISFQLGRLYFNQGDSQKAIQYFQQVLKLAPQHLNGLYSLGLALEKEGNRAEALVQVKKALELSPQNQVLLKKFEELSK